MTDVDRDPISDGAPGGDAGAEDEAATSAVADGLDNVEDDQGAAAPGSAAAELDDAAEDDDEDDDDADDADDAGGIGDAVADDDDGADDDGGRADEDDDRARETISAPVAVTDDDDDDDDDDDEPLAPIATAVLDHIASSLVDDPDAVHLTATELRGRKVRLSVHVAPDDLGRLIGRRGRVAASIRTVVSAAATRDGVDVEVEFAE